MPLSYYITQTRCNNNNVTVTFESVLSVVPHHNWSHAKKNYTAHAQRICVWSCSSTGRISPVEQCLRGERNNPLLPLWCGAIITNFASWTDKNAKLFFVFSDEKLDNHRRRVWRRLDILIYFLLPKEKRTFYLSGWMRRFSSWASPFIFMCFFHIAFGAKSAMRESIQGKKQQYQKKIMASFLIYSSIENSSPHR